MTIQFHGVRAARDYLLEGFPLTRVEALLLFGVPDLTKIISDLRAERYIVVRSSITFAAALVRLRQHIDVGTPTELPVRDIQLTEYRVSA